MDLHFFFWLIDFKYVFLTLKCDGIVATELEVDNNVNARLNSKIYKIQGSLFQEHADK